MKILSVLFALLLFASCSETENTVGQKTTVELPKTIQAGEFVKGEIITTKIPIKNTGDYPLIISSVSGSCKCTVAKYPENPIAPGESGEIMTQINTDKTNTGIISKDVTIVANTNDPQLKVTIKAKVNPN